MDQKHYNHMMQNFDPNHDHFGPQAAGMEFLAIPSSVNTQNPSPDTWQVDDSSLLCLLPGEDNLPQSQGLSLSLCHPENNNTRDGFLSRDHHHHHHQLFLEDGRFFQLQQSHMKYLLPVQELLNEFCNLGAEGNLKRRLRRPNHWEEGAPSSSPSGEQSLSSMDLLQLQKRKAKLLTMLDEVDRRYRRYCEQMRAVVSSFEAVAGDGAATVYSTLASKAMSRHFRALRDGIVDQLSVTKKAIGEKDASALGTTRGETPRLKVLDLRLRQEKAIQQAWISESPPWRPQRGLPDRAVSVLRAWLFEHFLHPYPSDIDKHILARQTGLSRSQVSNWFINARVRLWKPMVEEMYTEELKVEQEDVSGRSGSVEGSRNNNQNPNPRPGSLSVGHQQNPTSVVLEQQLPTEPDSLASVIISARRPDQSYGGMDMDFSSYSGFGDVKLSGGSVSLTLGLQQKQQQQNAGYRNFEGVQLLHDC